MYVTRDRLHICITRDRLPQVAETPTPTPPVAPVPAGRLTDQLCFALYAASNAMTRVYRPLLQAMGLTYPQYLVLLVLWEHGSKRLGEIADELRLATHAVSPIVDRLEEGFEIVAHLASTARRHHLRLKALVPREAPRIASVADLFPTANWLLLSAVRGCGISACWRL